MTDVVGGVDVVEVDDGGVTPANVMLSGAGIGLGNVTGVLSIWIITLDGAPSWTLLVPVNTICLVCPGFRTAA